MGNSTNLLSKLAEGSDRLHTRIPLGFWGIIYMQSEKIFKRQNCPLFEVFEVKDILSTL